MLIYCKKEFNAVLLEKVKFATVIDDSVSHAVL